MRKYLVNIWRSIMRSHSCYLLTVVVRSIIETRGFNCCIDMLERLSNGNHLKDVQKFYQGNKERIKENLHLFEDDRSRYIYQNIIAYRCTLRRKHLKGCFDKIHYFDENIVHFSHHEVFIDCGSYIGDTLKSLERFYPFWKSGWLDAICFEPDTYNAKRCQKKIDVISRMHENFRCFLIKKGTWNKETYVGFDNGAEYASKILPRGGGSMVEVTSIDCAVQELKKVFRLGKVTFIKMDVEGSEPQTLEGAKNIILSDHPILAISIYHTDEQMIGLIEWIHANMPFYDLYIRHYSHSWTETILYAVDPDSERQV